MHTLHRDGSTRATIKRFHQTKKAFEHTEIPQIIMDSHLFDYADGSFQNMEEKAIAILNKALQTPNCKVSISWHPRTATSDYLWLFSYKKLLQKIK